VEFRVAIHTATGGAMVEVWHDARFIASIFTHKDGLRIVSKYLDGVEHDVGYPPAVILKLSI